MLRKLVEAGGDLSATIKGSWIPVRLFARAGYPESIYKMVELRADLITALMVCTSCSYITAIKNTRENARILLGAALLLTLSM